MTDASVTPRVSVIIPNLNGEKLLSSCLNALKQSTFRDIELVLVDNGSEDDSIDLAKSILPEINIVTLGENQGFAGAIQRGIEASKGDYIAVLNNDAVPEAEWIEGMVRAMESDARIGMVACRVLNRDGTQIDSMGLGAARNGMAVLMEHGKSSSSPPWYPGGIKRGGTLVREPFGPSGAAGMYRREMLDQIGGFPERFFCYYEDLWVAWQGRLRGWTCALANDAVVRHLGQGTTLAGWKNRQYWITLNRWRTIFSCWHPKLLFRYAPLLIWWDLLALLGDIIPGRFLQAMAARLKALSELGHWAIVRKTAYAHSAVLSIDGRNWLIPSPKLSELIGRRFQ